MKRLVSIVCGCLVLLMMFVVPGNAVLAEENDCQCPGTVITGAERNKLVADLLKSDEFKAAKKQLMKEEGYTWAGAGAIEVRDFGEVEGYPAAVLVYQVVFVDQDGSLQGAAFFNIMGEMQYSGEVFPIDEDHDHEH
ncbi:hypothetical protein M3182_05755 [Mesobacillus maritimus]|uniref:hypothetical protein n=1 Tax=Mesobacillus maritimus TaxID=1643336 RepID=UPI00203F02C9|nr:hypothetical protein [Mesobacillus maritimus]MCM3585247.1 hypothetical protein [Mesobacillus maritimus]